MSFSVNRMRVTAGAGSSENSDSFSSCEKRNVVADTQMLHAAYPGARVVTLSVVYCVALFSRIPVKQRPGR